MPTINVHEARTHLSRILDRVAAGEEIVLAKGGKPVARLVPVESEAHRRIPGTYAGRITISADFDAPLPAEVLDRFEKLSVLSADDVFDAYEARRVW